MSELNSINYDVMEDESSLFSSNDNATQASPIMTSPVVTEEPSFEQKVRDFIINKNPCVYILTPCYGGMCHVDYLHCLLATMERFRTFGIDLKVEFCKNDSLVSRARNNLVAKAMNNPKTTHIMFIDSDISWDPIDIIKLLLSDKQLVGGIYPLKYYDWKDLIKDKNNPYNSNVIQSWITRKNQSQFKDAISDEALVQHKLLRYNVNYINNTLNIEKNLAEVRHLATGFMMFKRDVIEKMSRAFPSTKYVDDVQFLSGTENDFAFALFDCGVVDDHYMSEDWMFCERWRQMGGKIFIDVSIPLSHSGTETFRGCYLSSLI
jgi:hypothetical protein